MVPPGVVWPALSSLGWLTRGGVCRAACRRFSESAQSAVGRVHVHTCLAKHATRGHRIEARARLFIGPTRRIPGVARRSLPFSPNHCSPSTLVLIGAAFSHSAPTDHSAMVASFAVPGGVYGSTPGDAHTARERRDEHGRRRIAHTSIFSLSF